ncbi:MAG TPA: glycosyltransferase family 39 protein [Geobacteraceae bacterium]
MDIPASENYVAAGQFTPEFWFHPPLNYFLLQGSMKTFGDNPYGWRMKNVLAGSLSAAALFLLALELCADARVACAASMLLAIDPLHVFMSRTVLVEVSAVFFCTLCLYFSLRYFRGSTRSPVPAGFFLGLCVASRWYYLVCVICLFAFAVFKTFQEKRWRWLNIGHLFSAWVLLPLGMYLLAFAPWFSRGHTLSEFLQMQLDAYRELQSLDLQWFASDFLRSSPSSPWGWFLRPLIDGGLVRRDGGLGQFFVFMNDPPVWLLTFPAAVFMGHRAWKERNRSLAGFVILFLAMYGQFVVVRRPIFLYSSVTFLPFVCILAAFLVVSLMERWRASAWHYGVAMGAIASWGLYLYPLVTGRFVPVSLYVPLFAMGNVHF